MKKLFFILTNLFIIAEASQVSAANPCDEIAVNPTINLTTSFGKLRYDFTKNIKELTKLSGKYGIIEQGLFASGLAAIGVEWEIEVNTISKVVGSFDICTIPSTIDIFVGFSDPVIYVSRDLEEGSCEYELVMRHERTHQQINKTALEYFAPLMKEAFKEVARNIPAHRVDSISKIDVATEVLTEKYMREIEPIINNFKKEIALEQSKLDSHTNYQLEGDLCKSFPKSKKR